MAKKKKKLKKGGKIFLDIILLISLCIALFSGYKLYEGMKEYKESEQSYNKIKESMNNTSFEGIDENEIKRKTYASLEEQNSDFVGWIYLADSTIDYPFVHTDNNDFYLYHLFTKEYNKSGCVFMDAENAEDFSDKNTVLYAHHMRNGTMFHDVVNYEKQEYYDTHKVIEIDTLDASYEVYPIAGMYTTGYAEYIKIFFDNDEDFMDYVNGFIEKSTFVSDETITPDDQIVLLSTCAYNVAEGRYALIGKLVKK